MGVHGLWRLIEPSGKPVPVESLENKVLAVDVSIWLHQAIKGFQDAKGAPAVNAHLLGIFHRVCKLLYFKVKPVFVFDGGVPALKKQTIAKRHQLKHRNISEADKIHKQLLDTLIKHTAVNKVLGDKAKAALTSLSPPKHIKSRGTEDMFKLPDQDIKTEESSSDEDDGSPSKHWNLHNIDTKSSHFKSLPADVRHEILTDLKETRKQSSWGRLHELPSKSDDFSGFQMKRLLKRYEVQSALEEAAKEIGGHSLSLGELEEILKDQGVISENLIRSRIASDENARYLYIKDIKKAMEQARQKEEKNKLSAISEVENESESPEVETEDSKSNNIDLELEKDLEKAIALSLQDQPSTSGSNKKEILMDYSCLNEDSESEEGDEYPLTPPGNSKMKSAHNYMMEYSGLTTNEIHKIIATNEGRKNRKRKLNEIDSTLNKDPGDGETQVLAVSNIHLLEPDNKKNKLNVEKNEMKYVREELATTEKIEIETAEGLQKKDISSSQNNEIEQREVIGEEKVEAGVQNELSEIEDKEVSQKLTEELVKDKLNEVELMSGSEDSDEFEEVENISEGKEVGKEVMEIKIETEKFEEEEDLFADVFTVEAKESTGIKLEKIQTEALETKDTNLKNNDYVDETSFQEEKHRLKEEVPIEVVKEDNKKDEDEVPSVLQESRKKVEERKETDAKQKLTEEELMKMREDLTKEQSDLRSEQGLRERLGANITDQMYKEAQDLLELFGLPYVIAPMEAEAQCAFLECLSLTDGTITDDSDIWLFGGKTVYKNFFNQSKHVLEYRVENIKHHFKLTREQMILLALLVGSDYTVGLQGVGPVTALEILAAFPSSNNVSTFTLSHNQLLMGLSEFKSWFLNGKAIARGKQSLRNKLKNISFTEGFPSAQVVDAYLNPTVDKSDEKFSWAKPDYNALIDFGREKFGWSKVKSEDILKPVMKRLNETKYQRNLLNYFQIKHNLSAEQAQKLMSERVKSAVKRIGQDPKDVEEDMEESDVSNSKKNHKKIETVGESNEKPKPKKRTKNPNNPKDNKVGTKKPRKKTKKSIEGTIDEEDDFIEIEKIEALLDSIEQGNGQTKIEGKSRSKIKNTKKPCEKKLGDLDEETNRTNDSNNGKEIPKENGDEIDDKPTTSNPIENIKIVKEKRPRKYMKKQNKNVNTVENALDVGETLDAETILLQQVQALSEKRMEELKIEAEKKLETELNQKKLVIRKLHRKEIIPQRERDRRNLMRTKMKAIEVYRKAKIDPSPKKKGGNKVRAPKDDAYLSESSSDSDL